MLRQPKQEDVAEIEALCHKHGIQVPDSGMSLISVDDAGRVTGMCTLRQVWQVEPLIAEEPMDALRLITMIEGASLTLGAKSLMALVDEKKEDKIKLFAKHGFEVTDRGFSVLEKSLT